MAISILSFIALVFFTGAISLIFLMNGDRQYVPVFITGSITLYMLIYWLLFRTLKRTHFIGIGIVWIFVGGFFANYLYHENVDSVNAEVSLDQYLPFTEGTKLATLDKKASLQLPEDNLIVLDGATALYPLYASFVQATYPEKEYKKHASTAISSKTDQAYIKLIDGKADIIFVAGPSEAQLKLAQSKGVTLNMTPIGREAFVFFVHAKNSVEGLSSDQIRDIYSGEITSWKDVGGKNDSIRAFQRPADSGSQTAAENFMGSVAMMDAPTKDIAAGMGGIISQVAEYKNYRNAIGYTFRFYSTEMVRNENIRLLEVDGVYPDKASIRSGKYPITAEFYAITAGTDNPHVQTFIDWILSAEGQELVENTGYVPVK